MVSESKLSVSAGSLSGAALAASMSLAESLALAMVTDDRQVDTLGKLQVVHGILDEEQTIVNCC